MSFEQTSLTHREGVLLDIDWVHEREELFDKILGEFGDPRLGQSISKRERDQVRPRRAAARLAQSRGPRALTRARRTDQTGRRPVACVWRDHFRVLRHRDPEDQEEVRASEEGLFR